MRRYFIVGTDTDCGKTYVTCQLINYLKQHKQRVGAIKPLASGCEWVDGQLISDDARRLDAHCAPQYSSPVAPFWRFEPPIAPHLAAAAKGIVLSSRLIAEACQSAEICELDYLLIEGAGGLMVPLNEGETWVDFLTHTKIPVILVVGIRLGCINHALLTEQVLQSNTIECLGWVANCVDPHMLVPTETIDALTDRLTMPLIAKIPFYNGQKSISKFEFTINI